MSYFGWEVIPIQRGAHKKKSVCIALRYNLNPVVVNDLSFSDILGLVVFIMFDFYISFWSCSN